MRASVCVNVARTPYRGLLLSPPFFLPFFSLLYLLCAPLYAPLLALRSRTCPQTAACLFNASSFPSSPSSSSLLRPCASLDSLSTGTSPLPQICFLSKMFPQAWPFSLYVSFRVVSYGFCNQDFFPHIFRALLFSSSLLAPLPLLLVPCSFSLSFLSSLRCCCCCCSSTTSSSSSVLSFLYRLFRLRLVPLSHAPGGKMTRTNRCCNFVITTVCSSTLLTKNRYRERSLRASRAQPAAEKFFGYNPSAWRT